jgi:hypothetical protein
LSKELKQHIKKNYASSIELKIRTQADVNVKITLEKAPINVEHVYVQVCKFKFLKGLLPKPHYSREHRKGLLKFLGQRMGKCKARPSPKKQHGSTSIESFVLDMKKKRWM